ncbi:MAG: hypothetical protein LBJ57_08080 [Prevotellaceae bacterium]|jgi:hypothetical protein|nr:hypothetical protein [Prevotellaceae bacterium]
MAGLDASGGGAALFAATAKASGATARAKPDAKRIFLTGRQKGSYPKSLNRVGEK